MKNGVCLHQNMFSFVIVVSFILMNYRCYYYVGIERYTAIMGALSLLLLVFMSFVGIKEIGKRTYRFEFLILIATFLTFLFSIPTEGLSPFPKYIPYLVFVILFYLESIKISPLLIEKVLVVFAVFYLICWGYQVSVVPEIVFGDTISDKAGADDRGFFRFYIETKEHISFLVFFFLACYNRKRNSLFVILTFVSIVIVVLHVARQMIFWTLLFAFLYYLKTNRFNIKKFAVFFCVLVFFIYIIVNNVEAVSELVEMTLDTSNATNGADSDNIRFKAAYHFLETYNNNPIEMLFGCGFPASDSLLAHQLNASVAHDFYLADVGYVGLYVNFGIVSIILYICFLFQVLMNTRSSYRYGYLKYYIAYMAFSFIGSHSLTSNLVFIVLSTYILKSSHNAYCNPIALQKGGQL